MGASAAAASARSLVSGAPLPRAFVGGRKDAALSTVLLTERVDSRLGAFQSAAPPRPFASAAQYERAMRQPLGQEWNTLATARELTQPEWTSRAGLIIQPLKAGGREEEGAEEEPEGASAPPPGPAMASLHRSAVAVAGKGKGKGRWR